MGMLEHGVTAIGCHDAECDIVCVADSILMGFGHRPGVKCSDLVVVLIGGDGALCCVQLW